MAVTLQITDGTDTVDFNDGTNLYLGAAFQMNVGDGPTTETLISGWGATIGTDAKAVISKKYNRLIRKAIRHYDDRRIDEAVWLVWQPDSQTDQQFAKVMGGGEVEVVSNTIGDRGGGVFAPDVIREGAWRDTAPDGTDGTAIHSAVGVFNKSDADGDNWLDIASTRTNDAPSLLEIETDAGGDFSELILAMKRGTTAELNNFNPHFNPTDQSTAHATTADTSAPGDFRIELTADNTISWDIADTAIQDYVGSYNVYVWAYQFTSNGDVIQARYTDDLQTGEYHTIGTTTQNALLFLGNFQIPATPVNPFATMALAADYTLGVQFDITGTETVYVRGMFLIPTDIPPMVATLSANSAFNRVMIDGVNEQSFVMDDSGGAILDVQVVVKGRYQRTQGGTVNRLFFYNWDASGSTAPFGDYSFNPQLTVTIKIVDRFLGLRGNT